MLKFKIGYPSRAEERQILEVMARTSGTPTASAVVDPPKSSRRAKSSTTFTWMTR